MSSPCRFLPLVVVVLVSLPAFAAQQSAGAQRPRDVPTWDDCNENGVLDSLDLATAASADCNGNLVPDECDIGDGVLLRESFEGGMPEGWYVEDLIQVTDQCARPTECDGPNFVYFGSTLTCDFDVAGIPFGEMRLPDLEIPAEASSARMTFCSAYEGEGMPFYDVADVYVNGSLRLRLPPDPQLDWETRTVDLSPFIGESVSISFQFQAMDQFNNEFLGWQVDNIEVTAFGVGSQEADCNWSGVPDECEPELDCDANGVPDECDIAQGTSPDCNANGVPDGCDVTLATSVDCNANGVPDECDLTLDLVGALANLEADHASITNHFPDTHYFVQGDEGTCIDYGSFNCINLISTDLETGLPYTGGAHVQGPGFGPGARYFTAKHPGLFAMVATGCSIDRLSISGGYGFADAVDDLHLSIHVDGAPYQIYVMRRFPPLRSVNQVIAIPGDGVGVTHSLVGSLPDVEQVLEGLAGIDEIYYMLVMRSQYPEPAPLRPVDAQEIVRELIQMTPRPLSTDDDGNGVPDECD